MSQSDIAEYKGQPDGISVPKPEECDTSQGDENPPTQPNKQIGTSEKEEDNQSEFHSWIEPTSDFFMPGGRIRSELPSGFYQIDDHKGDHGLRNITLNIEENLIRGENTFIDQILSEMEQFWEDQVRNKYRKYGYLHKRGYMLYGKHGCGKSSIALSAIQNFLKNHRGYGISPGRHPFVLNSMVKKVKEAHPETPMICYMEDLESVAKDQEDIQMISNLLDGSEAVNNILFLSTTNYPEKLDPKFLRSRRFDRIIEVPAPREHLRREYLKSLCLDGQELSEEQIEDIVNKTEGMTFSSLSEIFISGICLGNDIDDLIERQKIMEDSDMSSEDYFKRKRPATLDPKAGRKQ